MTITLQNCERILRSLRAEFDYSDLDRVIERSIFKIGTVDVDINIDNRDSATKLFAVLNRMANGSNRWFDPESVILRAESRSEFISNSPGTPKYFDTRRSIGDLLEGRTLRKWRESDIRNARHFGWSLPR